MKDKYIIKLRLSARHSHILQKSFCILKPCRNLLFNVKSINYKKVDD